MNIITFNKVSVVVLNHIQLMKIDGKKINFYFQGRDTDVQFETEEECQEAFETIREMLRTG